MARRINSCPSTSFARASLRGSWNSVTRSLAPTTRLLASGLSSCPMTKRYAFPRPATIRVCAAFASSTKPYGLPTPTTAASLCPSGSDSSFRLIAARPFSATFVRRTTRAVTLKWWACSRPVPPPSSLGTIPIPSSTWRASPRTFPCRRPGRPCFPAWTSRPSRPRSIFACWATPPMARWPVPIARWPRPRATSSPGKKNCGNCPAARHSSAPRTSSSGPV